MRSDLPTGTVTFLFTDVEGSTKLLHELGAEAYADALAEHRRVIREACAAEGGVEVDTQGDAFFFAFPTAPGGVAAAVAITEALALGAVQVRIGLHTGTPLLAEEGYVGGDVHRAARIAAAGHGGQVLVSGATAQLVEIELSDLGDHRFKDVEEPIRVHQVGCAKFAPLKTISNSNLPRPVSSFVGRAEEVSGIVDRLRDGGRLVTLTGPGGTGKTRLAIEAAAELIPDFANGVSWVGLAAVRDHGLVTEVIGQTLGARVGVAEHIADGELLLVLDNLEQVIDCAPELASLLADCPRLRMLVTSRELLRVQGEVEYAVPPLVSSDAVALFCERAQLEPSAEAAELCERLDSLPLAVELAAARTKALSVSQILERLSDRLDLLEGGRDADPRQQTLRATIEWSYDLLSLEEQRLFARLSVFAGGCSLEAVEEIVGGEIDTLQSLVEKSLVRFSDERYWMLETIREFAAGHLEGAETAAIGDKHAAYFARLADCRWPDYMSGDGDWRQVVDLEYENLVTALEWSLAQGEADYALAIGSGVWPIWANRGYSRQGRQWLERALALPSTAAVESRAHALTGLGDLAQFQGDLDAAEAAFRAGLALLRIHDRRWSAACLTSLADIALQRGDLAEARRLAEESVVLRRELGSLNLGRGLVSVAEVALAEGKLDEAETLLGESLEWMRAEAPKSAHLPLLLEARGEVARRKGAVDRALRLFFEALKLAADLGEEAVGAECLDGIATVWMAEGKLAAASLLAGSAARIRKQSGLARYRADRALPEPVEPEWSEGRELTLEEAAEHALRLADA